MTLTIPSWVWAARNLAAILLVSLVSTIYTMARIPDLLPGTLDLLILRTLQKEVLHGWAVSERIQQVSQDVLQVNQGSLYPALHRLEHQGWIEAEWKVSELGRRAKYYNLTATGRRQLGPKPESGTHVTRHRPGVKLAWTLSRMIRDLK